VNVYFSKELVGKLGKHTWKSFNSYGPPRFSKLLSKLYLIFQESLHGKQGIVDSFNHGKLRTDLPVIILKPWVPLL
jgi:hypothetical protein